MEPQITFLERTLLIGMRIPTSVANDKARELWQGFIPKLGQIETRVGTHFYSVQNYDTRMDFEDFTLDTLYEKWATVEVSDLDNIPEGLESFVLEGGKYAVFTHKGPASTFANTWKTIFREWLPKSEYVLDKRPHFEILSADYRPDDPNASEDVWIPIK